MEATIPKETLGLVLRIGLFVFLAYMALQLFFLLLGFAGPLIAGALGTFLAAIVANAIVVRIFERGGLSTVGLGWDSASFRSTVFGVSAGILGAALFTAPVLLTRAAHIERDPQFPASLSSFVFLTIILVFGAFGEELLFRGYAFQALARSSGPFAALLPTSLLFALAHSGNQNASILGLINTFGFGLVLGYAYLRTGSLWLPIALHFGWNWALVVFGLNVSGFRMGVTGYVIRWNVSELWSGGAYGPEASLLTCGVIVALLWALHRAPLEQTTDA